MDANLVIYDQVNADTYKLAEATTTRPYARTMALDPKTKKIFLPAAEFLETPATDPSKRPVRTVKPGSFGVLVVSK